MGESKKTHCYVAHMNLFLDEKCNVDVQGIVFFYFFMRPLHILHLVPYMEAFAPQLLPFVILKQLKFCLFLVALLFLNNLRNVQPPRK